MSIFYVMLVLIATGFLLWLVNRMVPMQSSIRYIVNAVATIAVIVWLLFTFQILGPSVTVVTLPTLR